MRIKSVSACLWGRKKKIDWVNLKPPPSLLSKARSSQTLTGQCYVHVCHQLYLLSVLARQCWHLQSKKGGVMFFFVTLYLYWHVKSPPDSGCSILHICVEILFTNTVWGLRLCIHTQHLNLRDWRERCFEKNANDDRVKSQWWNLVYACAPEKTRSLVSGGRPQMAPFVPLEIRPHDPPPLPSEKQAR